MKKRLNILFLKMSIFSLQKKRKSALLDISINNKKIANRVDNLEDIRSEYFKSIDKKITLKNNLINILYD